MSITFNGASSKLTWAGAISTSYPITIFGWIKPNSASTSQMCFGSADFGGDDELMAFADGAGSGTAKAFSRKDGGSSAASSEASLSLAWQPCMVVFASATSRTVYYGAGSAGTDSENIAAAPSTHDRLVVGCRGKEDTLFFGGDIAEIAVWSAALGPAEFTDLASGDAPETVASGSLIDAWSLTDTSALTGLNGRVLTPTNVTNGETHPITRSSGPSASFTVTTADATFSGSGYVRPMASFAVTASNAVFSGSASTGAASATINGIAANATFSGSATGDTSTGVIATPALKNNAGTVLANETGVTVYVYNPTTGALVVKKTGQTTNASGVLTVTDALIAAGTQYRVVIVLGSGAEGMDKITAS